MKILEIADLSNVVGGIQTTATNRCVMNAMSNAMTSYGTVQQQVHDGSMSRGTAAAQNAFTNQKFESDVTACNSAPKMGL